MNKSAKISHLTVLRREEGRTVPKSTEEIDARSMRAFREQAWYGEHVLAKFLGFDNYTGKKILEVGPAEAGLLQYFRSREASCTGIELSPLRFAHSQMLNDNSNIKLVAGDICDPVSYNNAFFGTFDVIVIRDVIEHIDDKTSALENMQSLLSKDGKQFISFPPRHCPFAGHQQTVKNPLCKIPYLHLLPNSLYVAYLRLMGHPSSGIEYLLATKRTRISVKKMERLFDITGFELEKRGLYFFRPAYKFRFRLPTLRNPLAWLPGFREVFSNGALYVLKRRS
ncbi:MAG: class I SAM-dependent methyltransferase [Candidatus Neomarinimicrobiota bacterium]|nr:class I SAM-dependent methyltransferase [Candidatus Neomarinimicrobiota bacterium]